MSGSLTVGANDRADNTGDLIVTFVDATPAGSLTTDGTRAVLPGGVAPSPPAAAAAVGYNTLTFGSAVQPLGTNLRAFSFFGTVPGTPTQNADGSITITTPSNGFGADLCTAGIRSGASTWPDFLGVAFGGGCYAEAVMSQTGGNTNPGMSFWLNDIESMNGGSVGDLTGRHWPGQAADFGNWIEVDIAEFDASGDSYGCGDHNWYGTASSFSDANTGSYGGFVSPVTPGAGIDWSQPHRFGWLWVPASGSATVTNIQPNTALSGAVVGTPGTTPTGWDIASVGGLSTQVVATGTTGGGKPYIDFRLFGTANGSDAHIWFEPRDGSTCPAPPSTNFQQTVDLQVIAGTAPPSMYLDTDSLDNTGSYLGSAGLTGITPTGSLVTYTNSVLSAAGAARLNPQIGFFGPTNGTAVDVTFRISNPQLLEQISTSTQGYQKFFFDGVQVGTTLRWDQWSATQTPPPVQGSTAYNVLDTRHVAFIFGCGNAARPVTVYSLSVWQKDASQNIGAAATTSASLKPSDGTYLVAPSISAQPGCVVTQTPAPTAAQWESCSLIWQPPPHAAILWTSGGAFSGAGGSVANPKFPPQSLTGAGETDAAASISGRARVQVAVSASVGATAGISARARIRAATSATVAGAGKVSSDFAIQHPGGTLWFSGALAAASGGISSRANWRALLAGSAGAAAGISGDATRAGTAQQYTLMGIVNGTGGISSNPWIGHRYFVAGQVAAAGGVIPFGGNAPLRVTNWVRNPRPEMNNGGTSLPAEWDHLGAALTMTIIGTGTEGGIPYIDLQFSNASAASDTLWLQTDQQILASQGQIWSYGMFLRVVGGSLSNVSAINLLILSVDSNTGTLFNTYTSPALVVGAGALASQWFHFDGVLTNDAGMNCIVVGFSLTNTAGAVNVTLRMGGEKAELAVTETGPQYLVVPPVGFVPTLGGSTSFVY